MAPCEGTGLPSRFYLNGHTKRFCQQTQTLDSPYKIYYSFWEVINI